MRSGGDDRGISVTEQSIRQTIVLAHQSQLGSAQFEMIRRSLRRKGKLESLIGDGHPLNGQSHFLFYDFRSEISVRFLGTLEHAMDLFQARRDGGSGIADVFFAPHIQ